MPNMDMMANDDVKAAWDAISEPEPVEEDADDTVASSDDTDDNDSIDVDSGEESDQADEAEAQPAKAGDVPDIDELIAQLQARDEQIAQQNGHIGHLVAQFDRPQAKRYEELDPRIDADAKVIAECEAEAAMFGIDPAYVHYKRASESWSAERAEKGNAVARVGRYVDEHPDAAELGDALAARITSDPAWRAQLRMTSMLPAGEIERGARAAIDGMYAQLRLEQDRKRGIAESKAKEVAAERQAKNDSKAKQRGASERAGVTPGKRAPAPSAQRDDDSFDAVLQFKRGGFWSAFDK